MGLTQEELAEHARLSARTVSDLERGVKMRPHLVTVRQLADALSLVDEEKSRFHRAARGLGETSSGAEQVGRADAQTEGGESRLAATTGREKESRQRLPTGGFLGSLPAGRLVARTEELSVLLGALEIAAEGQGRLVLLSGEAGIGKTRLAQEATLVAYKNGFLIAAGRCYEPQQSVPYYPFLEALSILYAVAPSRIQSEAAHRWPYLTGLLPDQFGAPSVLSSDNSAEQERLFRAVTGLAQAIAEVAPVAILLDDLHWADSATLQLVQHMARQTRASRVFIVGTYRDAEVHSEHLLEAALRELSREQLTERVRLKRLEEDGTASFISETMGEVDQAPEFSTLVHRHTDGNPFFTQQVLQAMVENGSLYRQEGCWKRRPIQDIEVPESVRSVIGQRITRLRPGAQEVLQEASILGPAFSFDDLLEMKAVMENRTGLADTVDLALTDAVTFGLVRVTGNSTYTFDHALTQQALYAALSPRRRRLFHLAAGAALENLHERTRNRRMAELAWHFLQGDDSEKALQYSLLAGDQAESVFAHAEAERHYRQAMQLIQEFHAGHALQRSAEVEVLEKLGILLKIVGRYDEGLEMLGRAAQTHHEVHDLEAEARVVAQIGLLCYQRGAPEEGIKRLQPLVDTCEHIGPSRSLAMLYSALIRLFSLKGLQKDQFRATQRLLEIARGLEDERLLGEAELHRGVILMYMGHYEEAVRLLEVAISRSERARNLDTLSDALHFTSLAYHGLRKLDQCLLYRVRSVEVAERLGDPMELSYRAVAAAHVTFIVGDWGRSRAYAEQAVSSALDLDNLRALILPLYTLGELSLYTGAWEEASSYLQDSITVAERLHRTDDLRDIQAALAEKDLLDDDPDGALSRLLPLLLTPGWDENLNLLLALAAAYLVTGDLDAADAAAAKAAADVTRQRLSVGLVDALRLQGAIATQRGAWEEAGSHLWRALQLARDIPYPWGEARALYECATMSARQDEPDLACEQFQAASAIFQRLGADPYRVRADRARQDLNRHDGH